MLAQEPLSAEQLLQRVQRAYNALKPYEVQYGLRSLQLPRITEATRDAVRWCIALQSQGLPITPPLLSQLSTRPYESTLAILHRLGDNKILTLIRDGKHQLRYILHQRTAEQLDPAILAQRLEARE